MTHTEYMRVWRVANRDRVNSANRKSYQRNREAILERQREAYAADPVARRDREYRRRAADPVAHRAKQREQSSRRAASNPAAHRRNHQRWHIMARYGLTWEQYRDLLVGQAGRCLICLRADRRLVVDHDHATGQVRGLLCGPCNQLLGIARDDPKLLARAARFLG